MVVFNKIVLLLLRVIIVFFLIEEAQLVVLSCLLEYGTVAESFLGRHTVCLLVKVGKAL